MDFKGQFYCERFFQILVVLFGLVGFIVGHYLQDFRLTFYFLATGGGISAIVCLPDWPWWNRHPLEWLEAPEDLPEEKDEPVEKKKKKPKKEGKEAKKEKAS